MNVLSLEGIDFGPVVFDPMLASYIVNPDDRHGLKEQSERILGHQMTKIDALIGTGKKQIVISQAPLSSVATYAADDARITLELARYYVSILNPTQLYLLNDMELPLSAVIARMEQNGVGLDLPYLKEFSVELSTDLARLETEIYALAGHGFNIGSPKQLGVILFDELKLKRIKKRFDRCRRPRRPQKRTSNHRKNPRIPTSGQIAIDICRLAAPRSSEAHRPCARPV